MRKVAIIFLLAVIVPSGALAWLALRSLHDEQLILRARQAQLYQTVADSFARQTETLVSDKQREFANLVEAMLTAVPVSEVANTFDERVRKTWPLAEVGFAVTLQGNVTSPNMLGRTEGRRFRVENDRWLCSRESIEVYVSTPKGSINLKTLDEATGAAEKTDPAKLAESRKTGVALPSAHSALLAPVYTPTIKTGVTALTAMSLDRSGCEESIVDLVEILIGSDALNVTTGRCPAGRCPIGRWPVG